MDTVSYGPQTDGVEKRSYSDEITSDGLMTMETGRGFMALDVKVNDHRVNSTSVASTYASEDTACREGYLILSFDRTKRVNIKTAVFSDVPDPRFTEGSSTGDETNSESTASPNISSGPPSTSLPDIHSSQPEDSSRTCDQDSEAGNKLHNPLTNCYGGAFWVGSQDKGDPSNKRPPDDAPISSPVILQSVSVNQSRVIPNPASSCVLNRRRSTVLTNLASSNRHHQTPCTFRAPLRRYSLGQIANNGLIHRTFNSQPGVSNHHNSVHLQDEDEEGSRKMLQCDECGKYYRNLYSLKHHICVRRKDVWKKGDIPSEVINGQVYHFCPECHKPFKWLGNLTRHFYVHTGQRFFKCELCPKEFFSAYQVKRHMNSHTGLRFKCRICDKPFTCKYACAWHARQHHAPVM